jgi:hypothetical protein
MKLSPSPEPRCIRGLERERYHTGGVAPDLTGCRAAWLEHPDIVVGGRGGAGRKATSALAEHLATRPSGTRLARRQRPLANAATGCHTVIEIGPEPAIERAVAYAQPVRQHLHGGTIVAATAGIAGYAIRTLRFTAPPQEASTLGALPPHTSGSQSRECRARPGLLVALLPRPAALIATGGRSIRTRRSASSVGARRRSAGGLRA